MSRKSSTGTIIPPKLAVRMSDRLAVGNGPYDGSAPARIQVAARPSVAQGSGHARIENPATRARGPGVRPGRAGPGRGRRGWGFLVVGPHGPPRPPPRP